MTPTTDDTIWRQRVTDSWTALVKNARIPTPRGVRVHEPGRARVVFAWPLSQVLHSGVIIDAAGIDMTALGPDEVWQSFRRYRRRDGFVDIPLVGHRYYDDNAWIGLACAQRSLWVGPPQNQTWLIRAEASMRFVAQAVRADGGVLWVEGGTNLHACSTGSAGLLAHVTAEAAGRSSAWRGIARNATQFLDATLIRSDELVADNISATGQIDPAVFTYNQGLTIQLRISQGDLDGATRLAEATAREFDTEKFYAHIASFNAIYCRALLRLSHETGDEQWREFVVQYLDEVWNKGRDKRGLFTNVGKYDKGIVLDHAALVGAMAAMCLTPDRLQQLA